MGPPRPERQDAVLSCWLLFFFSFFVCLSLLVWSCVSGGLFRPLFGLFAWLHFLSGVALARRHDPENEHLCPQDVLARAGAAGTRLLFATTPNGPAGLVRRGVEAAGRTPARPGRRTMRPRPGLEGRFAGDGGAEEGRPRGPQRAKRTEGQPRMAIQKGPGRAASGMDAGEAAGRRPSGRGREGERPERRRSRRAERSEASAAQRSGAREGRFKGDRQPGPQDHKPEREECDRRRLMNPKVRRHPQQQQQEEEREGPG